MNFLTPSRLVLLIAVVALVGLYVALQARRRTYAVKFTNIELLDRIAPRRPGWRRHVPAAFFLLAMTALVVGFAQPTIEQRIPRERATIMLAIDTSLSMEATDVAPSRITAAKAAATAFIDLIPPKINIGLVEFNGNAVVKVTPTTDHATLKAGISNLKLGESTAIGTAITTSLSAIQAMPPDDEGTKAPARIVVMSDGKTTVGTPNEVAAAAAVEAGVPVSTIAFGTDKGTISVDDREAPVPVPVDEASLQGIADAAAGKFYAAYTEDQLRDVYGDIGSSIGYTTQQADASAYFIGGALVFMLLTSGASLAWFSRLP